MTHDILFDLQTSGYLTRTSHLAALGHGRRAIESAVADSRLLRICGNWVATSKAPQTGVIAVLNRGKLTGSTALASYGVWDGVDLRIHVHVPGNAHGPVRTSQTPVARFTAEKYSRIGVRRHWLDEKYRDGGGGRGGSRCSIRSSEWRTTAPKSISSPASRVHSASES